MQLQFFYQEGIALLGAASGWKEHAPALSSNLVVSPQHFILTELNREPTGKVEM